MKKIVIGDKKFNNAKMEIKNHKHQRKGKSMHIWGLFPGVSIIG